MSNLSSATLIVGADLKAIGSIRRRDIQLVSDLAQQPQWQKKLSQLDFMDLVPWLVPRGAKINDLQDILKAICDESGVNMSLMGWKVRAQKDWVKVRVGEDLWQPVVTIGKLGAFLLCALSLHGRPSLAFCEPSTSTIHVCSEEGAVQKITFNTYIEFPFSLDFSCIPNVVQCVLPSGSGEPHHRQLCQINLANIMATTVAATETGEGSTKVTKVADKWNVEITAPMSTGGKFIQLLGDFQPAPERLERVEYKELSMIAQANFDQRVGPEIENRVKTHLSGAISHGVLSLLTRDLYGDH